MDLFKNLTFFFVDNMEWKFYDRENLYFLRMRTCMQLQHFVLLQSFFIKSNKLKTIVNIFRV